MSCYHPLRAIITGYEDVYDDHGNFVKRKKNIKILSKDSTFDTSGYEEIKLPCGHCIGCRLKYSRTWADRCMVEASYHENNLFLTLTYDNQHLPEPLDYISLTGEKCVSPVNPLDKRALQLFFKRLRKKFPDQKIRYFACGEYGGKSMRPHYHIILFGLKLPDQKLLYQNDDGFNYFISDSISNIWPFGFHIITDVNWQTCAYVARYIVKKQYGDGSQIYQRFNFPPEFTLMSRKPGIGRQFYEDNKFKLYSDDVYIPTEKGAHKIQPNRYYDSLYDIEYPDHMFTIKEDRKHIALVNEKLKSNLISLEYYDMLESEEAVHLDRVKSLKRKEL